MPVRRNCRGMFVEALLLSPVAGLLIVAGLEIQQAVRVQGELSRAAERMTAAPGGEPTGAALDQAALATRLNVPADAIRVLPATADRAASLSIPYRHAGGMLGSFWATESIAAESGTLR